MLVELKMHESSLVLQIPFFKNNIKNKNLTM